MMRRPMSIGIVLSGRVAAGWREPLAANLRADGHRVSFLEGPRDLEPSGLALLSQLERLLYGGSEPREASTHACEAVHFDLIVSGNLDELTQPNAPILFLACDGSPSAPGAAAALLDMRSPTLEARFRRSGAGDGVLIAWAKPALEEPGLYFRSRERVEARLAALARSAVRRLSEEGLDAPSEAVAAGAPAAARSRHPVEFAARSLSQQAARRLSRLVRRDARWRVGWRIASGDEVAQRGTWSAFAFHTLPDDGRRYYADPFVCAHEGRVFVFCEEVPYATGRGILSVFEIRDGIAASVPRPVLERSYHLSYPMVFFRDGTHWMIPESRAANRIELWRADRFPDSWTFAAILVEGVAASDTTIVEREGRLWLFAATDENGGSSWDNLSLWSSDRLEGPWTPHPANPVVLDASCARPGGMPFLLGGRLIRPAQDCSRLYGGGLALCSIDHLDSERFSQSLWKRLGPPPGTRGLGVHTLNADGNVEAIDIFGPRPWATRRNGGRRHGDAGKQRLATEVVRERPRP